MAHTLGARAPIPRSNVSAPQSGLRGRSGGRPTVSLGTRNRTWCVSRHGSAPPSAPTAPHSRKCAGLRRGYHARVSSLPSRDERRSAVREWQLPLAVHHRQIHAPLQPRDSCRPGRPAAPGPKGHSRALRFLRQAKLTSSGSSPSTRASSRSPRTTGPTPAGVPVKIRSPGASSTNVDNSCTISGMFQIMSAMSPL